MGDESGVGRPQQIAQQGVQAHGQGDGGDASAADGPRLSGPGQNAPAATAVEHRQRDGGEHLADHHSRHYQAHRPLRVLGQEQPQQPQHRRRAHQLLAQLGDGGRAHQARPVKPVLVKVFYPREGHAGHQQNKPQLGAGIPQQDHGYKVRGEDQPPAHGEQHQQKQLQTGSQGLVRPTGVSTGKILGRQVGHRRRQPHRREGQHHGVHGHEQLIEPHDLGPHHAGQGHPITKAQQLGHRTQHRQQHRPLSGGRGLLAHGFPSSPGQHMPGGGGVCFFLGSGFSLALGGGIGYNGPAEWGCGFPGRPAVFGWNDETNENAGGYLICLL